jgi:hypothetical protein
MTVAVPAAPVRPAPPAQHLQPAQPQAVAAPVPPQPVEKKEVPISTGGWFGIMFLLALPALNLLLLIIWAVGGANRENKRNFARAVLLWMVIGTALSVIIMLVFSIAFTGSGGVEGIREFILEKIGGGGVQ